MYDIITNIYQDTEIYTRYFIPVGCSLYCWNPYQLVFPNPNHFYWECVAHGCADQGTGPPLSLLGESWVGWAFGSVC